MNIELLKFLQGTTLFYPCSGRDVKTPFYTFAPYITDFWFVDCHYFTPNNQDTRNYGYDVAADHIKPFLVKDENYIMRTKEIKGNPVAVRGTDIDPCTLTETYTHLPTNSTVRIHRCRRYGFSALRNNTSIQNIGVFFYRGDSMGEGGSGNRWLASDHLEELFKRFVPGGLIVTDGSNARRNYRVLGGFDKHENEVQQGYEFRRNCVSYTLIDRLKDRANTCVWQVYPDIKNTGVFI